MDPAYGAHIYVRGRCSTTALLNNFLNRSQPVLAIFRIAFYNLIFLICVTTIRWNYLVHVGYETSLSHNSRPRLWILHMGFTFMWEGGVVHNPYQGYVKWLKFRKQADRLSRKKVAWVEIFVVIVPYGSGEANMVALASIPSFPLMEWWCIRA